jgi:hypothetical protein
MLWWGWSGVDGRDGEAAAPSQGGKGLSGLAERLHGAAGDVRQIRRGMEGGRRQSKSELTIPERASAAATSTQGRLRAINRRGGEGGKARNTRARERNLSITITRNQSSTV